MLFVKKEEKSKSEMSVVEAANYFRVSRQYIKRRGKS